MRAVAPVTLIMTDDEILNHIALYQDIQKQHSPKSEEWVHASESLRILFAEMALRTNQPTDED